MHTHIPLVVEFCIFHRVQRLAVFFPDMKTDPGILPLSAQIPELLVVEQNLPSLRLPYTNQQPISISDLYYYQQ